MERKNAVKRMATEEDARVRAPGISLRDLTGKVKVLGLMNEYIITLREEKRMFAKVALNEKQSSISLFETTSVGLQYFLLFDLNEKYVKVGKSKKDGWLRKVLKLPWCQVKQRAVISPGRETTMKSKIEKKMKFVGLFSERYVKRNIDLPNRVKRHARKIRMKRIVRKPLRRPPSLSTLQGPTFKTFAIPMLAEKIEVR